MVTFRVVREKRRVPISVGVAEMKKRSYLWVFVLLTCVGFTADQWSKYTVFRWLAGNGQNGEYDVLPGWFKLIAQVDPTIDASEGGYLARLNGPVPPRVNYGALFGLGGERRGGANLFFMSISVLAAVGITVWATRRKSREDFVLCFALGLIVSGTLGNLFDRIVFGGVRDFLYFYWFEFPVFNVADSCLVCGVSLLILQAIFDPPPREEEPKGSATVELRPAVEPSPAASHP
jgi:signal peptidase II